MLQFFILHLLFVQPPPVVQPHAAIPPFAVRQDPAGIGLGITDADGVEGARPGSLAAVGIQGIFHLFAYVAAVTDFKHSEGIEYIGIIRLDFDCFVKGYVVSTFVEKL